MGNMAYDSREADRLAALAARRTALRAIPAVAAIWIVLMVVWSDVEVVLRIGTLVAVALSVVLGARAAVTARTFVRRWLDEDAQRPPPMWVTLAAVAGAVATLVGAANVAADISSDRTAVRSIVLTTVFLGVTVGAALAHVTSGRGVAAALATPSEPPLASGVGAVQPLAVAASEAEGLQAPPIAAWEAPPVPVTVGRSSPAAPHAAWVDQEVPAAPGGEAPPTSQLGALRMLLRDFVTADGGEPTAAAQAAVAVFSRVEPAGVVASARAQLGVVRSRRLDEQALAQVVTLLGCQYDPTEQGGTYRGWLAAIESALAAGDAT